MKQKCEEIEELDRNGRHDVMNDEVKSLDCGKKCWKGMWLIEDENNEEITDKQGILNTWQKYVEELYETRNRQAVLDIKNETDISEDETGFPILMKEVEVAIKEMKNGKATGVDGIPIELVKFWVKGRRKFCPCASRFIRKVNCPKNSRRRCYYQYQRKILWRNVRSSGLSAWYHTLQRLSWEYWIGIYVLRW